MHKTVRITLLAIPLTMLLLLWSLLIPASPPPVANYALLFINLHEATDQVTVLNRIGVGLFLDTEQVGEHL